MSTRWIADNKSFADFCEKVQQSEVVAIDTEFIWTTTFYARLALVQIAANKDDCALVDPLKITDTSPFRCLLENPKVQKVFHEAASDLPILHRWCGAIPQNIFDTRLAAAFCGLTASCSLNRLLHDILGILLPKTETRSNWLQRPLTQSQLNYAMDDVVWMPELARQCRKRLEDCGNFAWFQEEMEQFSEAEYYVEDDPMEAWTRIKGSGSLNERERGILQELAAWREVRARRKDCPRRQGLPDDLLLDLARLKPQNILTIQEAPGMRQRLSEKFWDEVCRLVNVAMAKSAAQLPVNLYVQVPRDIMLNTTERLLKLNSKRAEARKIDPVYSLPRRLAEHLVIAAYFKKDNSKFFLTWRAELLGDALYNILTLGK